VGDFRKSISGFDGELCQEAASAQEKYPRNSWKGLNRRHSAEHGTAVSVDSISVLSGNILVIGASRAKYPGLYVPKSPQLLAAGPRYWFPIGARSLWSLSLPSSAWQSHAHPASYPRSPRLQALKSLQSTKPCNARISHECARLHTQN
jgi:hypothetical protein